MQPNPVIEPELPLPPQSVAPTIVQARPGATTVSVSDRPSPPLQPALPKIAVTPDSIDPTTLLPRRGPQAAARRASMSGRWQAGAPMTGVADVSELTTPGLWRRMACFVYEGLLLFGIGLIPGVIGAIVFAHSGPQHPLQTESALRWFAFVLYGVYFVGFWSTRGQTLAMQTWHIRLVTRDGQRVGRLRALARYLAACVWFAPAALLAAANHWGPWASLLAIAVGVVAYALLTLLQPQRQFWHDVLCGTRLVVSKPVARPR